MVAPQDIAGVLSRMMKQVKDSSEGRRAMVWETRFILDVRHLMIREDGSFRLTHRLIDTPDLHIVAKAVSETEVVRFLYDLTIGMVKGQGTMKICFCAAI